MNTFFLRPVTGKHLLNSEENFSLFARLCLFANLLSAYDVDFLIMRTNLWLEHALGVRKQLSEYKSAMRHGKHSKGQIPLRALF